MRLLLPLAAVLLLSACGSGSSASSTSSSAASGGRTVRMSGLAFTPARIDASVGETVTFVNDDTPPHNVEPDGGVAFTGSPTLQPGARFHLKLTHTGTVRFVCSIHPFMTGTIVVR